MTGIAVVRRAAQAALDRLSPSPVLIGHSQTRAIFAAAAEAGFRLKGYDFWTAPQPAFDAARTAFHPEIAAALSRGTVFSAVGGSAHAMVALVRHPRPFDLVLPDAADLPLDSEAELMPFAAVRAAVAEVLGEYLDLMRLVRRTARGRVIHLAAPPPPGDDPRLAPDVPWMFFGGLTREVSPAPLRYKVWRVHQALVAEFCTAEGIELLPPPPESMDAGGGLKPMYYGDAMHVNEAYGALAVAQMRRAL